MGNWSENREDGNRGEGFFMRAVAEMGYTILNTNELDDRIGGVDVQCMKPIEDGFIELMQVDVKHTSHPATPEACFRSERYNNFMVEWESGADHYGTPLSDTTKHTTHFAYVTRRLNIDGREPFYLVSIEDLRAFYLKHRNNEKFVKRAFVQKKGKDIELTHARNIDMMEFTAAYGFEYYYYDASINNWKCAQYGNGTQHYLIKEDDGIEESSASLREMLSFLNSCDKSFVGKNGNDVFHEAKKDTSQITANKKFNGDINALENYITRRRNTFEPEYKPD